MGLSVQFLYRIYEILVGQRPIWIRELNRLEICLESLILSSHALRISSWCVHLALMQRLPTFSLPCGKKSSAVGSLIMRIYLVEDSDLLRERLVSSFSGIRGVEVAGFSDSADQAILQIQQSQPDVIILDIRLRQGNGFQVLQSIKKPGQPPTVIVLTNFAYTQYRKRFLDAGADYFFDKSSEFSNVNSVLEELLVKYDDQSDRSKKKRGAGQVPRDSHPHA